LRENLPIDISGVLLYLEYIYTHWNFILDLPSGLYCLYEDLPIDIGGVSPVSGIHLFHIGISFWIYPVDNIICLRICQLISVLFPLYREYFGAIMAREKDKKSDKKDRKRRSSEKVVSPAKRAKKVSAPHTIHTVSRPPPTPPPREPTREPEGAVHTPFLPRPFPSNSYVSYALHSEPPPVRRMVESMFHNDQQASVKAAEFDAVRRGLHSHDSQHAWGHRDVYRPETSPVSPVIPASMHGLPSRSIYEQRERHVCSETEPMSGHVVMQDADTHSRTAGNGDDIYSGKSRDSPFSGAVAPALHDDIEILSSLYSTKESGAPVGDFW
jgi:hypothetical protein